MRATEAGKEREGRRPETSTRGRGSVTRRLAAHSALSGKFGADLLLGCSFLRAHSKPRSFLQRKIGTRAPATNPGAPLPTSRQHTGPVCTETCCLAYGQRQSSLLCCWKTFRLGFRKMGSF